MAAGDLCQLADVKAWLNTGGQFPATDDALLGRLISAESAAVLDYLQRPLLLADWQETRDGLTGIYGQPEARFPFGVIPCAAVLSVAVSGAPIPALPGGAPGYQPGYEFTATQLIIRGFYIPRRAQCVSFAYTAGYPAIPAAVEQAAIELVCLRYRQRTRIGELSKRIGEEVVSYDRSDIPPPIKRTLQPYRLVAPLYGAVPQLAPTATDSATLAAAIA